MLLRIPCESDHVMTVCIVFLIWEAKTQNNAFIFCYMQILIYIYIVFFLIKMYYLFFCLTIDPQLSLPSGWPRIPQLFVRQSWDLSTCMSPAVNKVTSHLELLQTIIEEWCAATEADLRSRMSSAATLAAKSRATSTTSQYTTQGMSGNNLCRFSNHPIYWVHHIDCSLNYP